MLQRELRQFFDGRQTVVHESRRQELALLVVAQFFVKRRADALHDRALLLSVDDLRIDHVAAIVDRRVFDDLDHASLHIDIDHRNDGGIRIA
jgi:hypothetical protein